MYFTSYHIFYEYIIKKPKREEKKKSKIKWQPHQGWGNKKNHWISPTILQLILKTLNRLWASFLHTRDFFKKFFLRKVDVLNNMLSMCEVEVFLIVRVSSASHSQRGQAAQPASCPTGVKTRALQEGLAGSWECCAGAGTRDRGGQGLPGSDGDRSYRNVPDWGSLENCTLCSWSANWGV